MNRRTPLRAEPLSRSVLLLVLLSVALIASACGDDGGSTPVEDTSTSSSSSGDMGSSSGDMGSSSGDTGSSSGDMGSSSSGADTSPPSTEGLVINEVAADGEPSDWVELYNGTGQRLNLLGFYLTDDSNDVKKARFEEETFLEAGEHYLIYLDSAAFPRFMLGSDELIILSDPNGDYVDGANWDEGQSPLGGSFGRIPDATGPFKTLSSLTPAAANVDNTAGAVCGDGMTTGDEACDDGGQLAGDGCTGLCLVEEGWSCDNSATSICSTVCGDGVLAADEQCDDSNTMSGDGCSDQCEWEIAPGDVVINEILASPIAPEADWIELYNKGAAPVDIGGWYFVDGGDNRYDIPATTSTPLAPGGFIVFERDVAGSFTFGLGVDDAVLLYDSAGDLVDVADWAAGEAPDGQSYGRVTDGDGAFSTLTNPTKGATNNP